jgi:hypothetical protein
VIAVGGDGTLHEVFVCRVVIGSWRRLLKFPEIDIGSTCAGGEWLLLERKSSPRPRSRA